jgi:hypothetical protein
MSSEHICKTNKTSSAARSTRRSWQFLAALYIHVFAFVILVVFSRNLVSTMIRSMLLPLLR